MREDEGGRREEEEEEEEGRRMRIASKNSEPHTVMRENTCIFVKKRCCVPSCFWVLWPTLFFFERASKDFMFGATWHIKLLVVYIQKT